MYNPNISSAHIICSHPKSTTHTRKYTYARHAVGRQSTRPTARANCQYSQHQPPHAMCHLVKLDASCQLASCTWATGNGRIATGICQADGCTPDKLTRCRR